jgi:outer membrane protein assembly factor BamB
MDLGFSTEYGGRMKLFLILCLGSLFTCSLSFSQEWTRFRGENGLGISSATTIPTQITEKDYNWNVELPGSGHSSPVIWGDKIFLTGVSREKEGERSLFCVSSKDGSILWEEKENFQTYNQHKFNSFAASTPTVDAERVYLSWTSPDGRDVIAFDHQGKQVWKVNVGKFFADHGSSASPVLLDGVLVVCNEHEAADSFIAGLDPKTGKELWRLKRETSVKASYATPAVFTPIGGTAQLVTTSTAHGLSGIDPKTGKVVWNFNPEFTERCVSSPVIVGDVIFITSGSGGGGKDSVAVRVGKDNKVEKLFQMRKRIPYVPTGVGYEGHFYLLNDSGLLACVTAEEGKVLWEERVTDGCYSSPISINGYIYCISREGLLGVAKASNMFTLISEHKFPEGVDAVPAVAGGKMYVRTTNRLISIGGK